MGVGTPLLWSAFAVLVVVALAVDFVALRQQGAHRVGIREAAVWSALWVAVAAAFCGGLWWHLGGLAGEQLADQKALEFATGYLVEKALAVDNIFVFLMVFTYFAVPAEQQKRVLMAGILGAIVLRGALILVGAWLLARFHWLLYLFGAFLLLTGVKMWRSAGQAPDLGSNPVLRFVERHLPIAKDYDGTRLVTRRDGRRLATPLLVVMLMIAVVDVIFAVDSIPAIFAITADPFIVLTSNVFAILGLRALYFLLAGMQEKFHLLSYGLALVLGLIGTKMLIVDVWKMPVAWSLAATVAILAGTMILSLLVPARGRPLRDRASA
jgi:tellurite resistance protein TerC